MTRPTAPATEPRTVAPAPRVRAKCRSARNPMLTDSPLCDRVRHHRGKHRNNVTGDRWSR